MMRPLTFAACLLVSTAAALAEPAQAGASAQEPVTPGAPATAPAAQAATAAPAGAADRGRRLTYTCRGCHGVTGYKNAYPSYHVPKIGGQSSQYLSNALTEYRKGTRKHPTMQAQAMSFSDQDIADIAAFLSSVK